MASAVKVLKMPAAELAPELREFLDRVVVPALVKKYFAEQGELKDPEKVVAVLACTSIICRPTGDRRAK
jgi:hypothetical protein